MPPEDRIRLEHMLEAADTVLQMVGESSRHDLDANIMLRLAVVRAIEIAAKPRVACPSKPETSHSRSHGPQLSGCVTA